DPAVNGQEDGGRAESAETRRDREREARRVGRGEVRSRRIQQAKDITVDAVLGDPRSRTLVDRGVHVYRGAELGACLDYVKEGQRFVRVRETARRRPLLSGEEVGARQTHVVCERLKVNVGGADALITVEPLRTAERAAPLHRAEERLRVIRLVVARQ